VGVDRSPVIGVSPRCGQHRDAGTVWMLQAIKVQTESMSHPRFSEQEILFKFIVKVVETVSKQQKQIYHDVEVGMHGVAARLGPACDG